MVLFNFELDKKLNFCIRLDEPASKMNFRVINMQEKSVLPPVEIVSKTEIEEAFIHCILNNLDFYIKQTDNCEIVVLHNMEKRSKKCITLFISMNGVTHPIEFISGAFRYLSGKVPIEEKIKDEEEFVFI